MAVKLKAPVKFCKHCGTRVKGGSLSYQIGACTYCINSLDLYSELRKAKQNKRFQDWYNKHKAKPNQLDTKCSSPC